MLLSELASFLLAANCAGCDEPGTLLCAECAAELSGSPQRQDTPHGLSVVSALRYEGVVARCIRRVKEEGETLLCRPLGAALLTASHEVADAGTAAFVPIPTSRAAFRRRGYRVPELLVRAAGHPAERILVPARATVDQRGLGRTERGRNVRGSMRAIRRGDGADVVLIDDVVTTGATLDEAAEVLTDAGFRVRGAVVLAATPRHS